MRNEKQLLLDEIVEKIDSSSGFIMVKYEGLHAAAARELRNKIGEVEGEFEVVRKRVFIKALEKCGVKFDGINLLDHLKGHVGVMFTASETATLAKTVLKFSDENSDMLTFVGGVLEKQFCDAQEVTQLAKLPPLNDVRAQFLGLLQAPMSQTVGTVQAALTSVLYCIDAKCELNEKI